MTNETILPDLCQGLKAGEVGNCQMKKTPEICRAKASMEAIAYLLKELHHTS